MDSQNDTSSEQSMDEIKNASAGALLMKDIGEKTFLKNLLPRLTKRDFFLNGFGNDASVIDLGNGLIIAQKIDRAAQPFAVKNQLSNFESWGHLAVISNLSDILAVGASGSAFMLSMTLPSDFEVEKAYEIVRGAEKACKKYNLTFAGGDTKEGPVINIVGTLIGIMRSRSYFSRRLVEPGNILVITGSIGRFASIYLKHQAGFQLSADEIDYIAFPDPRLIEATVINEYFDDIKTAMDNSDGLAEIFAQLARVCPVPHNLLFL